MTALEPHRGSVLAVALVMSGAAVAAGRPAVPYSMGQATATVGGRVTFEGAAPPRPADVSRITVVAQPAQQGPAVAQSTVRLDGTFEFSSLQPGRYRLGVVLPPTGVAPSAGGVARWNLKSALLDGADVADIPFEVRAGDRIVSVAVAMSDRTTDFSGSLFDAETHPVAGRTVIVFATDSRFWFTGSRRLPLPVRSDDNGTFRFTGLPPGDYRIAALTDATMTTITETFLTQLSTRSVPFTLAVGETKVLNLQVGR